MVNNKESNKDNMKTRRQIDADAAAMSDEEEEVQVFTFNGQNYDTYQGMVDAKRKRNRDVLASSGLLEAKAAVDNAAMAEKRAAATARGLKRSKAPKAEPLPRRKSSRLSGEKAAGKFIDYLYII